MSFELKAHTADVGVEATGETLGALFAAIADGLTAAMSEEIPEEGGERFEIELAAESIDGLLYDYLDQLIYERDAKEVLPVDHEATVREDDDALAIEASYRGVPFDTVVARDVKAVTYSEMIVEQRDDGWYGYVVFDV